ncbi:MAG: endonuclease III [Actinobacteria bacterium]|nr:endonuclease III [Actinomycetota bacterium]MCG2818619.1 endonuclease III [Actinomycetes bacterium]MBU4178449.1 endonuclease III [Actinomycetota bacterium]MBU4218192.1 endonuclease III [Actinomycetota bacterium]MBU4358617.1 endonuclease III [Actinomycetota bacterium]
MERREKALEVDRRLARAFGSRLPSDRRDMIHELIHAVLSQNTSRNNYDLAYRRLTERFPSVEGIATAPLTEVEEAIRPGGLSQRKSVVIQAILAEIHRERGEYSLEFLGGLSVGEAREFLTSLTGVGPKTASVVLMFAGGRKVLPVDTHVLRTTKRIGLIDKEITAERAQQELEELVPPAKRPRTHLNLVRLGREVCRARATRCEVCPVNNICEYQQ